MAKPGQFSSMPPYMPEDIRKRLEGLNVQVRSLSFDAIAPAAHAFREMLMKNDEWKTYYKGIIADKWLEHFLSVFCLSPQPGTVMLDVASHWSPFYKIVQEATGVKVIYVQDTCFEAGIHENRIGSDCIHIPLPDGSVDVISVNNSIEHFEGNKDTLFIREAFRLLKPGGRLCIVPLFINSVLVNMADPESDLSAVEFDEGAVLVSASPWKITFARHYTPESFVQRVVNAVPTLECEVVEVLDMHKFDASLNYWQFVAIMTKSTVREGREAERSDRRTTGQPERLLGSYRQIASATDSSGRYLDAFVEWSKELKGRIYLFGYCSAVEQLIQKYPEKFSAIVDLRPEKKGCRVGPLSVVGFEDFKKLPAGSIIITDVALQYLYLDLLYFEILHPQGSITVDGLWKYPIRYNYVLDGIAYGNDPEIFDFEYLSIKKSLPMECTIPADSIIRLIDCVKTAAAAEGDILEIGTGEGGSTFYMASTLEMIGANKKIYSVDGFDPQDYLPNLSYEVVSKNLKRFPFVKLIKGHAPESLRDQPLDRIAFAFIDFYALPAILEYVYPRVNKGGMILIDNYNHGCFHNHGRPIADSFFLDKPEKIIRVGGTQGLIVKQ